MLMLACAGAAQARSAAETMDILMWNREPVGGPFELVDQTGKPRSDRDFRGRLMLVYFGFTYCPDVCPTDLMAIGQALEQLGPDADAVQPVFITLDPERDTAEHLAEYVPLFHPRLLGLTGSLAAIGTAAEAYKVYFAKIPIGKKAGDYTVDHTSFIYLMDRDGRYLGFFPPGTSAERMAEIIRPRLAAPSR
ncbi:SCO family protein [Bradyrhizobium sp. CB1717]|uniref:SCO family protein n=1 Tax=Bradyrhizobium sp. CB1717 TaxID=3039154 RepID=UPI0024B1DB8C|nr:SCO family protein [Bradyrhizobium sp. CB1717]WFU28812.1 SCO family protein [Bradyrhizobium sp. CB1717]